MTPTAYPLAPPGCIDRAAVVALLQPTCSQGISCFNGENVTQSHKWVFFKQCSSSKFNFEQHSKGNSWDFAIVTGHPSVAKHGRFHIEERQDGREPDVTDTRICRSDESFQRGTKR
jgi:hypothetical protein